VEDQSQLSDLLASYGRWLEPPEHVLKFERRKHEDNVPGVIHILFFLPVEGPNEDDITTVATAGMSRVNQQDSYERIELGFELKGTPDEKLRATMARRLADLALVPFRTGRPLHPNIVLESITLPPFEKMSHVLVSKWNESLDLTLPGIEPKVYLLRLIPLFENEGRLSHTVGDVALLNRLKRKHVVLEDYDRDPADI
jgi:hypothetical protein